MNWYKLNKFAQKTYIDFFHKDHKEGEYLWMIDSDFRFYKKQTGKEYIGHGDWNRHISNDVSNDIIASGRFGPYEGKTLATMVIYPNKNIARRSWIRNKVEKILNEKLDYPIIKEFG